jgi:hypothetical protein
MKTLLALLWLAVVTYAEQLLYHLPPVARLCQDNATLRMDLQEAQRLNAQLRASAARHLTESVVMLYENECLEKRNAYLESLLRRRSDLSAAAMLRVEVGIKSTITEAP